MKHYFDVEIAKDLGINAAIVFENIAFWIRQNEKAGRNERDGAFWMYATQKDIAAQFEYLSEKQTRTALARLSAGGYIATGCYNKHQYDRTAWYRLTDKGARFVRTGELQTTKRTRRKDLAGGPIQDIKPNIKPDIENKIIELKKRIGQA